MPVKRSKAAVIRKTQHEHTLAITKRAVLDIIDEIQRLSYVDENRLYGTPMKAAYALDLVANHVREWRP